MNERAPAGDGHQRRWERGLGAALLAPWRRRSCRQTRARLPLFAGGELPASAARHVREHLRGCFPCSRELGRFLQARAALSCLRPPVSDLPATEGGLADRVLAAVQGVAGAGRRSRPRRAAGVAVTAAAVLLLALSAASLGRSADGHGLLHGPPLEPVRADVPLPSAGAASGADVTFAAARSPVPRGSTVEVGWRRQGLMGRTYALRRLHLDPLSGTWPPPPDGSVSSATSPSSTSDSAGR